MTSNLPWVLVPLKAAPGTAASATALGSSPAASLVFSRFHAV